jgi:mono/diheme cytochrome c family protein
MGSAHRDLRVGPLVVALLWAALWNLWLAPDARAQRGDREGEAQPALPDASRLPPPPFLSPEEAARRFVLEPGWRIDLVAAEPLIEAPVQASFDADGRLWVVEMRGYMPDIDGRGEDAPVGRVSVLFDDDGDGRMDRATRFLEGLVLPRALAFARDGVLVIAPPHVLSCRDIDGDFVADERVVVDSGIEGIASPEYGPNGLLHLRGAWLCANHDRAYAWRDGAWTTLRAAGGGQYGLTRDDAGRVYHNNNSDLLRGNLVDGLVLARNPHLDRGPLVDAAIARDHSVHPAHPTPGVNRAYREGWLRDGRIQRADAACSPHVARGDAIPSHARGDVFVCEPAGNLVKQLDLVASSTGGFEVEARHALAGREVLASTDERFRPVSLCDGPDGALYVVDMHRGVIQHKNFVTSFLRRQVLERKLESPLDAGRIWRMSRADAGARLAPRAMSSLRSDQLVALLDSEDGWTRDTAARLLAQDDFERAPLVDKLRAAAGDESPRMRRLALELLDELDAVGESLLLSSLSDRDLEVRLAAVRAWRKPLERNQAPMLGHLLQQLRAKEPRLRWEAWATLSGRIDLAAAMGPLLRDASDPELRRVAWSGWPGRAVELFEACMRVLLMKDHASWDEGQGRREAIHELAVLAGRERQAADLMKLVDIYATRVDLPQWLRFAMIDGLLATSQKRLHALPAEPRRFLAHLASSEGVERAKAEELHASILWPGRADLADHPAPRPLTEDEARLQENGRRLYGAICAACHHSSGAGESGKAPSLHDSRLLLGDARVAARILLGGLEGPLQSHGRAWDSSMPAWNGTDQEVAAVLTYARREWGHAAEPATLAAVEQARADSVARGKPWTAAEAPILADVAGEALLARGLEAFERHGDAAWSVVDGVLVGKVGGGAQSFLATRSSHGDFVLEVDVRLAAPGNSGIQLRSRVVDGRMRGPQVEIDPSPRAWSGGLYDEGRRGWLANLEGRATARAAFDKDGWNRYRIEARGPRYRVHVNGVETCDALDPLDVEGCIAFQVHSGAQGEVHWRDPRLVDLGSREWREADPTRPLDFGGAEEVLRLELEGRGARLEARCADSAAASRTPELVPGVRASAAGLVLEFDAASPPGIAARHEWHLTLVGERVALHKDGVRVFDATVPGLPSSGALSLSPGGAKLLACRRLVRR